MVEVFLILKQLDVALQSSDNAINVNCFSRIN